MSDETESVHNPAFPIDRKIWVPQIAMLATFIIAFTASRRGLDIPAETQVVITGLLTTAVGGLVGWLTPMARAEVKIRVTNSMVEELQADPESKVNLAEIIDNDIVAEAQANPVSKVNLVEIVDDKIILAAQISQASPASIPKGETIKTLEKKLAAEELKPVIDKPGVTPTVMSSAPKPKSKRGKA